MTAASTRPTTLEEALRALDEAEAKLRSRENDETGIRRLTESVLRSEERFRALAEGVPNHLLFLDQDLRIVFANDVFLEAFGWSGLAGCGGQYRATETCHPVVHRSQQIFRIFGVQRQTLTGAAVRGLDQVQFEDEL